MKKFVILFIAAFLVTTDAFASPLAQNSGMYETNQTLPLYDPDFEARLNRNDGSGGSGGLFWTPEDNSTGTTENDNDLCDKMTCASGMFCSAGCCSFSKN